MADVVVISLDERGFWHADLYRDASDWDNDDWDQGKCPDCFFTTKIGTSLAEVRGRAASLWPDAEIREAQEDEEDD